jgi:hypothetical protein
MLLTRHSLRSCIHSLHRILFTKEIRNSAMTFKSSYSGISFIFGSLSYLETKIARFSLFHVIRRTPSLCMQSFPRMFFSYSMRPEKQIPNCAGFCAGVSLLFLHGRLGAFALCNLMANHAGNKRLARRLFCVREMSTLLRTSPVLEIQSAAAACIYNVACKTDKEEVVLTPSS